LLQTIGVGLEWRFAGKFGLRLTPAYEQGEYVRTFDAEPKAGEKDNEKNVAKSYRGKAAIIVFDKAFELQVGADFASRKLTIGDDRDQAQFDAFTAQDLHTFAAVNVVF